MYAEETTSSGCTKAKSAREKVNKALSAARDFRGFIYDTVNYGKPEIKEPVKAVSNNPLDIIIQDAEDTLECIENARKIFITHIADKL